MNNLFNNLTTSITSTINNNNIGPGNNNNNNNNVSLNDIPKEELINLLMKMQKRMQLLETKGNHCDMMKSILILLLMR